MLDRLIPLLVLLPLLIPTAALAANDKGMLQRISPYGVDATVERLTAALQAKGAQVFARIDHAAAARSVGLELPPTVLLIFGNPKGGTPLMQAAPSIALDLPLKVLVQQDAQGTVQVLWNDPAWLADRHGLSADAAKPLAALNGLVEQALKP